jgi:hypothetical protein
MNLSSINLRFFANIAPLVSGLNKAERAMDRAGKKMQAVGKNLTMKVTAPIVGLGAVAVNTFQGFELQMAKVAPFRVRRVRNLRRCRRTRRIWAHRPYFRQSRLPNYKRNSRN